MRYAVMTDIHANREAFDAVMVQASQHAVDQWVFLGDMVGFGPDPGYVVDKIESMVAQGAVAIRGNHDRFLPTDPAQLNPAARRVVDWTVDRLNARQKLFLSERPLTSRLGDMLFVHAGAYAPQDWPYIKGAQEAERSFASTDARLTLCGHSHVPHLYSLGGQIAAHNIVKDVVISLATDQRWLAIVGAVGMPRDGRAVGHYCILDPDKAEISFHETPYDAEKTAQKIRAVGMPLARHFGLLRLS